MQISSGSPAQNQNTTAMKKAFQARFPGRNPEMIVPIAKDFKISQIAGGNAFSTVKQANIHEYSVLPFLYTLYSIGTIQGE